VGIIEHASNGLSEVKPPRWCGCVLHRLSDVVYCLDGMSACRSPRCPSTAHPRRPGMARLTCRLA